MGLRRNFTTPNQLLVPIAESTAGLRVRFAIRGRSHSPIP
jgi:hypothetical protein